MEPFLEVEKSTSVLWSTNLNAVAANRRRRFCRTYDIIGKLEFLLFDEIKSHFDERKFHVCTDAFVSLNSIIGLR